MNSMTSELPNIHYKKKKNPLQNERVFINVKYYIFIFHQNILVFKKISFRKTNLNTDFVYKKNSFIYNCS